MLELTVTLIAFLFPLAYSPGPGNMFFAANGARFGFAKTINSNVGYHVATWIVTFIIGLGFGWLMIRFPLFLLVLKYLGSSYVLFLAWTFFRAGMISGSVSPERASFVDGAILLILNPKAYLIIGLMFSQFLKIDDAIDVEIVLWITTIFTLNNFIAFCLWIYVGDLVLSRFRDRRYARKLNIGFGVILACVAFWMLIN